MKSFFTLIFLSMSACLLAQNANTDFHLDKDYAIKSDGTLDLKIKDAKLVVTGSSRSGAHVKIDRTVVSKGITFGHEDFNVEVKEESGNLILRETGNTGGVVGYYSEKYKITIDIPEGVSLKLRGNDGSYIVQSVNGSIDIHSDDADIELMQCKGSDFAIKINDGKIRMDRGQGKLLVRGDDADVNVKNANFTTVEAHLNDGDFTFESSLTNNGEYAVSTEDGSVAFTISGGGGKFDVQHNDGHVSTSGDFTVNEKSDNRSVLTLADGSANVRIHTNDGNVRLIKK